LCETASLRKELAQFRRLEPVRIPGDNFGFRGRLRGFGFSIRLIERLDADGDRHHSLATGTLACPIRLHQIERRFDEATFAHQNPYGLHRGGTRTDVYDKFAPEMFLPDFRNFFLEKIKYCAVISGIR